MATIRLRSGHVQPVWAGHPWVFAQAIEDVEGAPAAGDAVAVTDSRGRFIGRGFYSPGSAIPVRILTRDEEDSLDAASLGRRIEEAAAWRRELLDLPNDETTGYRLIHSEGDRLAGLIVDVFGSVASVQFLTAGMKRRDSELIAHIARVTGVTTVLEVASERMQRLEGFEAKTGVVRGPDIDSLQFRERGLEFELGMEVLQKTGFFLDQRDNRREVERLAKSRRVLDAFCYVGCFGLFAARGGATAVTSIDSAARAIATGATLAARHGFGDRISFTRADLKRGLADLHQRGERFDLVVVDPPKLAATSRQLEGGRRAYRRMNANAIKLVADGGLLLTCSCSGAMKPADFLRTLGLAARDAKRELLLLQMGQQAPDHPVPAAFPEGRYLKCAYLRVRG